MRGEDATTKELKNLQRELAKYQKAVVQMKARLDKLGKKAPAPKKTR